MIHFSGCARDWYQALYERTLNSGTPVACRQGLGLELCSPVHLEIPPGKDNFESLVMAIVQRRPPERQRVAFSVAHGVQKFLGLPEIYLSEKFPILKKYIRLDEEMDAPRISCYMRERLPEKITKNAPWIQNIQTDSGMVSVIDQLYHVYDLLMNTKNTRRAYIDFNEGYKPRCVSSWHFIIRDGFLHMFQNLRSNDLLVGLPNDIVSARICQIILAKITGTFVGPLHHHASIVQVYAPDCAGVDAIKEFSRINFINPENHVRKIINESALIMSFLNYIEQIDVGYICNKSVLDRVREDLGNMLESYIYGDICISEI